MSSTGAATPGADTITSLKYTAGITAGFCFLALLGFSLAVRYGYNGQLAPRTWARPRKVLQNVLKHRPYGLSWIPWTLRLTYIEMIQGIPGTGTRKNGKEGSLLKCNLDGIIILKFHTLLLKVALFATIVCCSIILPLNMTAACESEVSGALTCENVTNLDSYSKTTLAHIPPMGFSSDQVDAADDTQFLTIFGENIQRYFKNDAGITIRLIVIVCVAWSIYLVTCYLVWNEWIDNLTWRRFFYLEMEHFEMRTNEVEYLSNLEEGTTDPHKELRQFLPNPETRETVPPIALYSSLYKLPSCDVDYTIEEMLKETADFFDKCVPNQPGFSSSVAACSILPDPSHIARSWSLWYKCASQARKLRFITHQLKVKQNEQGLLEEPDLRVNDEPEKSVSSAQNHLRVDTSNGEVGDINFGSLGLRDLIPEDDIETLAVFEREFAQSAQCCPNGMCFDSSVRKSSIEELLDLRDETREQLQKAKKDLLSARGNGDPQQQDSTSELSKDEEYYLKSDRLHFGRELRVLDEEIEMRERRRHRGRNRADTDFSNKADAGLNDIAPHEPIDSSHLTSRLWQLANQVAINTPRPGLRGQTRYGLSNGRWGATRSKEKIDNIRPEAPKMSDVVTQKEKYAVVTFTSRQAAVAARQCVADASGKDRWVELEDIPTPPLADAPPYNILFCRGCCKPVTLTMSDASKSARHHLTMVLLILFCTLYTVPLSLTTTYFSASTKENWSDFEFHSQLQGLFSGALYTIFFSICPFIFKALANFGSNATSIRQAEFRALRYYWFFILVTAFAGNSLVSMAITGYFSNLHFERQFSSVLMRIAGTIPSQSDTWLNWIIIRFFFTLPFNYLLQFNTFLFNVKYFRGCSRALAGSGAGGQLPYRLYVDAGLVFLCVCALGPVAPLLAPAGLIYFLVAIPVLRWGLIFVYRPVYDGGGLRWPLLHDIIISAIVMSQVLLTAMMLLKQAHLPALMAGLAIIPTINFSHSTKKRFLRQYKDTGLLQTSQLDVWDSKRFSTWEKREEFRKWLVDGHKASFIPICLAGEDSNLTWEPAAVLNFPDSPIQSPLTGFINKSIDEDDTFDSLRSPQKGVLFRRMSFDNVGSLSAQSLRLAEEKTFFNERSESFKIRENL